MSLKHKIEKSEFGRTPQGDIVHSFILEHKSGLVAKVINFGGIVTELHVPDANGNRSDIVLGFKDVASYLKEDIYAGALVGRIAGRLTNGKFIINDKTYQLPQNEGLTHLHGGVQGFDKKLWDAEITQWNGNQVLELTYHSPDGEEGYPGNLDVTAIYSLTDENGLRIDIEATTDFSTPFCPTSHIYFNLAGEGTGDICDHILQIDSNAIAEVDNKFLPTGNIIPTISDSNDYRKPANIRQIAESTEHSHGAMYLLDWIGKDLKKAGSLSDPLSGRTMEVYTNTPGIQLYTGSGLCTETGGKSGVPYRPFAGLCLECQGFSDAPNHNTFEPIWLHPGQRFSQSVEYRFRIKNRNSGSS